MKALLVLALLLGACASHVVRVADVNPDGSTRAAATFDIPKVKYVALEGNGTLLVTLDGGEVWRLDVAGKKAWKRTGAKLDAVPWAEAAAALGLPVEP